jgi:hypothetical protein
MDLRRTTKIAACMLAVATGPAAAQAPWPTQQQPQQAAPAPWGAPVQQPAQAGPSPWSPQPQQPPPCVQAFFKLRDEATKRAGVIRVASEKHNATPQQACAMFNAFSAAEAKMIKYAVDNATSCGIPQDVAVNLKKSHAKTLEIRTRVCAAAAAPPRPVGPTLSDALNAPITDSKNIKTGRGTFDTLTGNPLGGK